VEGWEHECFERSKKKPMKKSFPFFYRTNSYFL
jgi:hypothetical protein